MKIKTILKYLGIVLLFTIAGLLYHWHLGEMVKSFGGYEMPDVSVKR